MSLTLKPLTIGIDARAAVEVPAGRGRVVRELLRELAARPDDGVRYVLYARRKWPEVELDGRFRWRLLAARDPLWHRSAALSANRECDIFLSTNSYLTLWFLRIPAVPIVYDLTTFQTPAHANRRSTIIERVTLGPAVRRAAAFLAISQASADALLEHFPRAHGRIAVAHLGVTRDGGDGLSSADAAALPAPGFVLAVGTLEPRKNLPRLVDAYRSLDPELQSRHPLAVVGALGWQTGETLTALRSLGEHAILLGYVSDAALHELYARCEVFCYPSLGEGFGLPVLEAMAAGAPVITSNVSSLPEVGGDAVEYVDPLDTASIATTLQRVLTDEPRRRELAQLGAARAKEFSWADFAEQALDVLQLASTRSYAPASRSAAALVE
jgi:glycosyltransferase involved in cell wall biosynthesis